MSCHSPKPCVLRRHHGEGLPTYLVRIVEGVLRLKTVAGAKLKPWMIRGLEGGTVQVFNIGLYLCIRGGAAGSSELVGGAVLEQSCVRVGGSECVQQCVAYSIVCLPACQQSTQVPGLPSGNAFNNTC